MRALLSSAFLAIALLISPNLAAQTMDPDEGRKLYELMCANCHGAKGDGGMASSLVDGVWGFGEDRSRIIRNIHDGLSDRGMPAYGNVLSDTQIAAMTDYFLGLASATTTQTQPTPADGAPRGRSFPPALSTLDYGLKVDVFADNLEIPWAIDFINADTALITERPGRLRVVEKGVMRPEPVQGIPAVIHEGQGGLMDVAVDPEYTQNGWLYLAYSHGLTDGTDNRGRVPAMTRIVRGKLEGNNWTNEQVLFESPHEFYRTTRQHYGCRIVFDKAGILYFAIGERGAQDHAQELQRPNGKTHRIHRDGKIPADNPFVGRNDVMQSIFSYGNRNIQGMAIHPETDQLWAVEHGPRGGDELNLIQAGKNYGWPIATYGINYNGTVITEDRLLSNVEPPILYWRPSIAVGGLDFYTGSMFPKWRNKALATALNYQEIHLLDIVDNRVIHSEVILKGLGRIREAVTGPDGAIYAVMNRPDVVLRLSAMDRSAQ